MKEHESSVHLTDGELLLLDGKCSKKAQEVVDRIKREHAVMARNPTISKDQARMVSRVVDKAKENGKLVFLGLNLTVCNACGRRAKEKKVRRKMIDVTFRGVEMAESFIRFTGWATAGCCKECFDTIKPALESELADIRAEMPKAVTGVPQKYKRCDNRKCTECGWEGYEGQMGMLPAIMGGHYPGKCPKCGAENLPFGERRIKIAQGFTLIEITKTEESAGDAERNYE